jgi:hypothetical protein
VDQQLVMDLERVHRRLLEHIDDILTDDGPDQLT